MSAVLTGSITALCAADHGNLPQNIAAWTANKTVAGISAMLSNPRLDMFVAERDGRILGVGAVQVETGMITLNYVDPSARFTGLSKAMLAHMETILRNAGHREARLESTLTARPFYRAQGWQEDGPQAQGRQVNGYPMRKRLEPA